MNMALSKQIPVFNVFILLIICNADSTMQNNNILFGHASVEKLVKTLSYDLKLDLSLKNILVFNVTSTNLIIIEKPARKIDLNINGLTIREYTFHLFRLPYMDYYSFKNHYFSRKKGLILIFNSDIPSGFYNMTIEFSRNIFENEIEVYKTSHKDYNGKARWILMMQLGPNGLLQIFSYWHKSASRARFAIALKQSWNYTVLSNMQIRSQRIENHSMIQTQFNPTPPVPSHVLTLLLTDFNCFIKKGRFSTSRICSASSTKEQITFALNISETVRSYMTFYTEMSPQFPEITHIDLPSYSDETVDNWESNFYREDHLIYNESLHPIDRKLDVSMFVARGTALQWFNHLFNPMLWTHVWFCQTLALFYGAKAFAKTYGDKDISSLFTYRLLSLTREDETVWQVMPSIDEVNYMYFSKVNVFGNKYIFQTSLKAYAAMVMLESAVTEAVFRKVTISYLKKHQFSTATPNDFWDAMEDNGIISFHRLPPVAHVVQSWLKLRSLPVITVTSNVENVVIGLEDVYMYGEENNNNTNDLWLPIKYVARSVITDIKGTEWLTKEEKIRIHPHTSVDWIIVNWQDNGYYRVKYDLPLLKRLAAYIAKNHANIDVLSRAQIIEDAYYFLAKYELDNALFKNLTGFMSNEEQCAPWYAIQNIIQKMGTCFNVEIDGCRIKYYLVKLLNQLIEKVGYTEHSDDMECVKFKRLLATKWVCRFNNRQCLNNAKKILMEHLKDPERHVILPMWEEWTYCNGLKRSDEFTWNQVLAEYLLTGNKKILIYLTCSQRIHIILKYLDLITSKTLSVLDLHGLNDEDRRKIYRPIVQKYILKDEVMDHIIKKLEEVEITDVFFFEMLNDVSENVYSMDQAEKILQIFKETHYNGVHYQSVYDDIFVKFHKRLHRIKKLQQITN